MVPVQFSEVSLHSISCFLEYISSTSPTYVCCLIEHFFPLSANFIPNVYHSCDLSILLILASSFSNDSRFRSILSFAVTTCYLEGMECVQFIATCCFASRPSISSILVRCLIHKFISTSTSFIPSICWLCDTSTVVKVYTFFFLSFQA